MNFDGIIQETESRWAAIMNDYPQCPHCDESVQVQIINWAVKPMEWRCWICCEYFRYQPQGPSDPKTFWGRVTGWLH
jgi:hypothetical protein